MPVYTPFSLRPLTCVQMACLPVKAVEHMRMQASIFQEPTLRIAMQSLISSKIQLMERGFQIEKLESFYI